jgi:hypothetical protein
MLFIKPNNFDYKLTVSYRMSHGVLFIGYVIVWLKKNLKIEL